MSLRRPTMDSYDYEEYDGEGLFFVGFQVVGLASECFIAGWGLQLFRHQ